MMRAAALIVVVAGCWGGGSGTITSFDGDTVIGNLSDANFQKLCVEVDRWNERKFGSAAFRRNQCEIEVAVALRETVFDPSGLQAQCRQSASVCESQREGKSNVTPQCQKGAAPCLLKVGQLEQCLTDLAYNMYGLFLTAPMCDDICRNVDPLTLDAVSCATVRATCPDLLFTRPSFTWLEMASRCGNPRR